MSALKYLFFIRIKNSILDLKKHPSKLILIILFVAIIVMLLFTSNAEKIEFENLRNINELKVIILLLFAFSFIVTIMNGFSSGASFFTMPDINLLFTAPISSKKILLYGLIRQMGTSLWIGLFLFYQYGWLHNIYGINFLELLVIVFGYCVVMFCAQLTSMVIYSFTSNDDTLKKRLKYSIITFLGAIGAIILYNALTSNLSKIEAIVSSANATWVSFIPVIGWLKACVGGVLAHDISLISLVTSLGATGLYVILMVLAISYIRSDFYEDVLQATEVSFSAITAKKEGKISDTPKNVKVGKTGLSKGVGSNVFFYKHLLENRRSGILFMDKNSLIFTVMCIIFSIFMRDTKSMIAPFAFATYMQLFSSSLGRWLRELICPFVYLIPDKAFKKLICITKEYMLHIVIEAVIMFIPIGLIMQATVFEIIVCIIARIGFGVLFMAGNILAERLFGDITNKTLIILFFILTMIILCAPGFVLGALLYVFVLTQMSSTFVILGSTFIWNIAISALIIFICRDILNYAELNNK